MIAKSTGDVMNGRVVIGSMVNNAAMFISTISGISCGKATVTANSNFAITANQSCTVKGWYQNVSGAVISVNTSLSAGQTYNLPSCGYNSTYSVYWWKPFFVYIE